MAQDWDIKARSDTCQGCGKPFEDRQRYRCALSFGEEGYRRGDYCEACWPPELTSASIYSTWEGTFRLPPPKPEEPVKKETAESLLRKLIEDDDGARGNVIYILAVMLERKRILVEKDVQLHDDGTMVRIYEHRKSGESFVVLDPRLRLDELEPVQAEVIEMLGGGTDKDEAPAAEPTQPAAPPADAPPESDAAAAGLKGGFYSRGEAP